MTHFDIYTQFFYVWCKLAPKYFCSHLNFYSITRKTEVPRAYSRYIGNQPGRNGQLSCLHSFKLFWPMKPSYASNEMTQFAAHFDVLKKCMIILKMCFSVNQIDDLQSTSNKKYLWTFRLPWFLQFWINELEQVNFNVYYPDRQLSWYLLTVCIFKILIIHSFGTGSLMVIKESIISGFNSSKDTFTLV